MAVTPIIESDRIGLNAFFQFLHDNYSGGVPWPSIAFGDILQSASNIAANGLTMKTTGLVFTNTSSATPTDFSIGRTNSQSNLQFNVPSGDGFLWTINNGTTMGLSTTGLALQTSISSYNGLGTAGVGMAAIRGSGSAIGSSAASATLATYIAGSTGLYRISGMFDCTAFTSGTLKILVSYTDGNSNVVSNVPLSGQNTGGSMGSQLGATGQFLGYPLVIWVKTGTTITVASAISATATGDFFAIIEQIQ